MTETRRQTLVDTLEKLRKRIQSIRDKGEPIGEQNTKATLIDPLLSALGWDMEDLEEVSREYKRKPQDNPVDYSLFLLRSPSLFVEAKGLERDLNDRKWVSQTLSYATVVGVEWCVLTNGDEYRLYNAHAAVDVEEKLFRTVRISDSGQEQYTLETMELLSKEKMGENSLSVLWKAHFVDRNVKAALDGLFKDEDSGLIRLIRKRTTGLNPSEIRSSLKRAAIRIDFPAIPVPQKTPEKESKPPVTQPSSRRREGGIKAWQTIQRTKEASAIRLIEAGIIHPPLDLEREYKGVHLKAAIQEDGTVVVDGKPYDSLSTAAGMARKSVIGAPPGRPYPQTNGWTFWRFRDPQTGKLLEIDDLRQKYLKRNR